MRPHLIIHADWSAHPAKRRQAAAVLQHGDGYLLHAPQPVGDLATWLERIRAVAGPDGSIFVGLDFPIGLPLAYARQADITDFVAALPLFGGEHWPDFYRPAETPNQIGLGRPFYPARPGNARRQHLLDGLGVEGMDDLRRCCDLGYVGRRPAAPIFWTMGAQQVGKAAISGWREALAPALRRRPESVALWPFAGRLPDLLQPGRIVFAESYPAEFYAHLGLVFPRGAGGKRSQAGRAAQATRLLDWCAAYDVAVSPGLVATLRAGFGASSGGEDSFDAVVGAIGMLNVILGGRPTGEPDDEFVRQIEGWILGRQAA